MTKKQRKVVRSALREYDGSQDVWAKVLEKTRAYYVKADPICWELLRLRYLEGQREDVTFQRLHIGRTTYYAKELEALSTVAVYAAQAGLLREE